MNRQYLFARAITLFLIAVCELQMNSSTALCDEGVALGRADGWEPMPGSGIIESSGKYFLQNDLEVDRNIGIEVKADNVTIDFGGHALRFTGAPREGVYGIVANGRSGISIANGTVGGFWFNVHCTQGKRLRIRDIRFDDIPYIAVNAAQSTDVAIHDNTFTNFRYDLPKSKDATYVIGINIGAKDVVISNNRFAAKPKSGTAQDVGVETVFVLFSADVSQRCVVTQNDLEASEVLPRSYGIWVATNAQATITNNSIRNLKYGVCLASDASALVCFNRFTAARPVSTPIETIGISAVEAKEIVDINNTFEGVSVPEALPVGRPAENVNGG